MLGRNRTCRRNADFLNLCRSTRVLIIANARTDWPVFKVPACELSGLTVSRAYEAARRLRPAWLQARGRSHLPVIYRDNARWGSDPRSLENIRIDAVRQMRFLSASDATTRYGTGFAGGVILVVTR